LALIRVNNKEGIDFSVWFTSILYGL
jgi:hypothetical protein